MLRKILKWTCLVLLFAIAGITIVTGLRQHVKYEAPFPAVKASSDSAVIARGRHIVMGPGHCFDCHSNNKNKDSLVRAGGEPALSGGFTFELPFGKFFTRNLTPDKETGIGRMTDGEIARVLRYGVKPNGEAVLPFMSFQNFTDEELTAVISYLRSLEPVRNPIPDHEYNLMGKLIKAYMIKAEGPTEPVKKSIAADTTAVYGRHLVMAVANCNECHTKRDGVGKYVGEPMAGGTTFEEKGFPTLTSPNLTPDPTTGRIYKWSQDDFIRRFRMGKAIPYSHMPWDAYSRMSDDELKAIYNYLKSLKPVNTTAVAKKD